MPEDRVLLVWLETEWDALNRWLETPEAQRWGSVEVTVADIGVSAPGFATGQTLLAVTLPEAGWAALPAWLADQGHALVGPGPAHVDGVLRECFCLTAHSGKALVEAQREHSEPALLSVASIRRIIAHHREGRARRRRATGSHGKEG